MLKDLKKNVTLKIKRRKKRHIKNMKKKSKRNKEGLKTKGNTGSICLNYFNFKVIF